MANDSYFQFEYGNKMKYKYFHDNQKRSGWAENTYITKRYNWKNWLNLRHTPKNYARQAF